MIFIFCQRKYSGIHTSIIFVYTFSHKKMDNIVYISKTGTATNVNE